MYLLQSQQREVLSEEAGSSRHDMRGGRGQQGLLLRTPPHAAPIEELPECKTCKECRECTFRRTVLSLQDSGTVAKMEIDPTTGKITAHTSRKSTRRSPQTGGTYRNIVITVITVITLITQLHCN